MGRVWGFDFVMNSHIWWVELSMQKKGAISTRSIHVSDSRFRVLMRVLVKNQVCNIVKVEIVLTS